MQATTKANKFPSPEQQGTHFAIFMVGPYMTKVLNEILVMNGYQGCEAIKGNVSCEFRFFIPNSCMNDSAKRFMADMVNRVKAVREHLEVRTLKKILGEGFHG